MNPLWLALRFFRLPLEVFGSQDAAAMVVARHEVVCANAAATALGIVAGMRQAAALGLAPDLQVHERQPPREADALARLACWAGHYTPHVCLEAPDTLLIEIGGCLRLFNGLDALHQRIGEDAARQGWSLQTGLAPTPRAAHWLALAGGGTCLAPDGLAAALGPLPVTVLAPTAAAAQVLASLGVRHVGELLALPRAGLARRLGPALVLQLARALGEVPDLRPAFVFPERFSQSLELPAKVSQSEMLLFGARRLLAGLAGWLAARAAGVEACTLCLRHDDTPPETRLELAFAGATRDLARMERVLRERLARTPLPAAVTDLVLEAARTVPLPGSTPGLFSGSAGQALEPVIERLRARLGAAAVHGLAACADHRPECATRSVDQPPVGPAPCATGPARPLWLLPAPQRIAERQGTLHHGGVLQRLAGPERIESGWWCDPPAGAPSPTAGDIRRDYYVALSEAGQWLWIYRDARGWWLHGVFA